MTEYHEYTIKVPFGWWAKPAFYIGLVVLALLSYPYYKVYLANVEAAGAVKQAQSQIEAKRLLGECP